jgi:hypothetical protein
MKGLILQEIPDKDKLKKPGNNSDPVSPINDTTGEYNISFIKDIDHEKKKDRKDEDVPWGIF